MTFDDPDETAVDGGMTADDPTAGDPAERGVPSKATLFCPDCRAVIPTRPTDPGGAGPRRGGCRSRPAPLLGAWRAGLRTWGRFWRWTVLPAGIDG